MSDYKVYLTKSSEAAQAIARGYTSDLIARTNRVKSVGHGHADGYVAVPAIYHGKGYFYCAVEFESAESKAPKYELVVC